MTYTEQDVERADEAYQRAFDAADRTGPAEGRFQRSHLAGLRAALEAMAREPLEDVLTAVKHDLHLDRDPRIDGPIGIAYARYDSDDRVNGPDDFSAFADALEIHARVLLREELERFFSYSLGEDPCREGRPVR